MAKVGRPGKGVIKKEVNRTRKLGLFDLRTVSRLTAEAIDDQREDRARLIKVYDLLFDRVEQAPDSERYAENLKALSDVSQKLAASNEITTKILTQVAKILSDIVEVEMKRTGLNSPEEVSKTFDTSYETIQNLLK